MTVAWMKNGNWELMKGCGKNEPALIVVPTGNTVPFAMVCPEENITVPFGLRMVPVTALAACAVKADDSTKSTGSRWVVLGELLILNPDACVSVMLRFVFLRTLEFAASTLLGAVTVKGAFSVPWASTTRLSGEAGGGA